MTQEEVAVWIGVSVARVWQIEQGDVSTQDVLNPFVAPLGGTQVFGIDEDAIPGKLSDEEYAEDAKAGAQLRERSLLAKPSAD